MDRGRESAAAGHSAGAASDHRRGRRVRSALCLEDEAITAPSCFICALNGFGKSTLLRRIALGDIARGTLVLVPGDVKPDLRVLTEQVGGQVSEVGYGTGAINPLDRGPIGDAIEQLPAGSLERDKAEFALHARQLNMICALLEIVRRGPLKDFEETLLASAIRLLYAPDSQFTTTHAARIEDLLTLIAAGPEELKDDAVADTDEEYRGQIKPLLRSLRALVKAGSGRPSTGTAPCGSISPSRWWTWICPRSRPAMS